MMTKTTENARIMTTIFEGVLSMPRKISEKRTSNRTEAILRTNDSANLLTGSISCLNGKITSERT
jgi:hypothetical protein